MIESLLSPPVTASSPLLPMTVTAPLKLLAFKVVVTELRIAVIFADSMPNNASFPWPESVVSVSVMLSTLLRTS